MLKLSTLINAPLHILESERLTMEIIKRSDFQILKLKLFYFFFGFQRAVIFSQRF